MHKLIRELRSRDKNLLATKVLRLAVKAAYFKTITILWVNNRKINVDIFVNPTFKDMKEIKEITEIGDVAYIRFIADPYKKRFYIWSTNAALHGSVAKTLNISSNASELYSQYYCGLARISGNRLKDVTRESDIALNPSIDLKDEKWQWIKLYVN